MEKKHRYRITIQFQMLRNAGIIFFFFFSHFICIRRSLHLDSLDIKFRFVKFPSIAYKEGRICWLKTMTHST